MLLNNEDIPEMARITKNKSIITTANTPNWAEINPFELASLKIN